MFGDGEPAMDGWNWFGCCSCCVGMAAMCIVGGDPELLLVLKESRRVSGVRLTMFAVLRYMLGGSTARFLLNKMYRAYKKTGKWKVGGLRQSSAVPTSDKIPQYKSAAKKQGKLGEEIGGKSESSGEESTAMGLQLAEEKVKVTETRLMGRLRSRASGDENTCSRPYNGLGQQRSLLVTHPAIAGTR
jgi:hypothetical protein